MRVSGNSYYSVTKLGENIIAKLDPRVLLPDPDPMTGNICTWVAPTQRSCPPRPGSSDFCLHCNAGRIHSAPGSSWPRWMGSMVIFH
jgi:hypothetical protein